MSNSPADKRILLIRLGRLGDMVMVAPAIRYLIQKNPDAKFTLLTTKIGAQLYKNFDKSISSIWTIDDNLISKLIAREKYRRLITKSHFEQIFCFENVRKITRILDNAHGEIHTIGQPEAGPVKHASERMLEFSGFDKKVGKEPYISLTNSGKEKAQQLLNKHIISEENYLVAFHPTFSASNKLFARKTKKHKHWPAENWGNLAQMLDTYSEEVGLKLKLIMDLTPADTVIGKEIVAYSNGKITFINSSPDLERYKALLARVDLLVTPNTGPMHLAAGLGTKQVALFAGFDPRSCGPYMRPDKYIVLRSEDGPDKTGRLLSISAKKVFQACVQLMENA